MDALTEKVAIAPVVAYSTNVYNGVEYFGVYPYVEKAVVQNSTDTAP